MARREQRHAGAVWLGADRIDYTLVRVAGRRHVHLLVENGRLSVRAPWRGTHSLAETAIHAHADWVQRRLTAERERLRRRAPLAHGAWLPLFDSRLRLWVHGAESPLACGRDRGPARPGSARRNGDTLAVWPPSSTEEALRETIHRWYRAEARKVLTERLTTLGEQLGRGPNKVRIAAQRHRWGSCSARGTISLNWRLLLLPAALADYVMIHELCHLRHLNHSPRFWLAVERAMPDYRDRRAGLKRIEGTLPL